MSLGFSLPSKCPFCEHVDTLLHCFLQCPFVMDVWRYASSLFGLAPRFVDGLETFLNALFTDLEQSVGKELSSMLPVLVCWAIWRYRNQLFFDGGRVLLSPVLRMLDQLLFEVSLRQPVRFISTNGHHQHLRSYGRVSFKQGSLSLKSVSWHRPVAQTLKLNVDGSATVGFTGGGFILRDSDGLCIVAKSRFFGPGDSLSAELAAFLDAIRFCLAKGFPRVCIELDSKLLVDMLHLHISWPWKLWSELAQARTLLCDSGYSLFHIYREANSVADSLAKLATSARVTHEYQFGALPSYIRGLIHLDSLSFPYVRARHK